MLDNALHHDHQNYNEGIPFGIKMLIPAENVLRLVERSAEVVLEACGGPATSLYVGFTFQLSWNSMLYRTVTQMHFVIN